LKANSTNKLRVRPRNLKARNINSVFQFFSHKIITIFFLSHQAFGSLEEFTHEEPLEEGLTGRRCS